MARTLLFYTHAFSGGGAEMVFARLAHAFARRGDRVLFVADHAGPLPVEDGANLMHVNLGSGHLAATLALAKILKRERPDASFSALGAQNLKHLAAASLASRRRRCVLGVHGFAAAEPKRLAQLSYRLAPLTTRLAACTICVSDALMDDMAAAWGARRHRMTRIHNPLPPDAGAGGWAPTTPPLVLAIGRLDPVKRFPDLVEAFAAAAPADAQLAILGEGPERNVIEATIARLGLDQRAALPGHVADSASWYRRATCLVVTSASESFGLTVAEALAHGVPVVATDCGGPPEVLGGLGRVVPVGDIPKLGAALAAVLADPGDPTPRRDRAAGFALELACDAYGRLAGTLD